VINVGLAETDPTIRKALAIGAHKAVRIDAAATDAFFVAEQIAAYAQDKNFDMILTGRESIDYNGGMVCGLLGGLLNLPSLNVVSVLDIEGSTATLTRDIDGGKEILKCDLPLVASAQKELTEPRIPNMRGIMAARTKPLEVLPAVAMDAKTAYNSFELPAPKQGCKMIDPNNAEELIQILH